MTGKTPPLGAQLSGDIERREGPRGARFVARVRWSDPMTRHREGARRSFMSEDAATAWIDEMHEAARTGVDPGQTFSAYLAWIGDRWARRIDHSSTLDPYSAGLRMRVLPALGHLPVRMLTAGLIDRAIDGWEHEYSRSTVKNSSRSTVKNSVAALVLVLDEAVRDGLILRKPAKDRARRRSTARDPHAADERSRNLALPDVATLRALVEAVVEAGGHQCWGDMVMILATTALRISEASGLTVSDVDLAAGVLHVRRQTYPGRGGLITKRTKGRRSRSVPIIEPLRETLERLTVDRDGAERLVTGPRDGVITTATLRDATNWDALVERLGVDGLVRHGLRHTALTWMANSGVPLHLLQRVAGHQDPSVTARYLHPDTAALTGAGAAFSAWWSLTGPESADQGSEASVS
jgi:integrase